MTRRQVILTATSMSAAALLAACGGAAAPSAPTPAPNATNPALKGASFQQPTATAGQAAPVATTAPTAVAAVAPTTAPAAQATTAPATNPQTTVPREKTLIIGFEGGPVQAPDVANPYVPGVPNSNGNHQVMIESLFYLNYITGEAIPWQAESFKYNSDYTAVDIKLRKGVEWADGQPFTADDVVFTLNILKDPNAGSLSYAAEMQKWIKAVAATDPLMVHVDLKNSYPRFIFNNFTVHIWGAVRIVPKHIWESQDPKTFKNFDLSKGWPIFTGPYKLVTASSNQFVFDRRDDWWGKKSGFKELPAPQRIVFIEAGLDDKKAAALQNNEVDGEPSIKLDVFQQVLTKNKNAIGWLPDMPYGWIDPCPPILGFNTQQAPWDDKDMRWAVNYAIDKSKVANIFGLGFGIPARYNFPAYPPLDALLDENKDLFDKYPVMTYDPKKSMAIFEQKGYAKGADGIYAKDGKKLSVDLLVKSESVDMPPLLVAQLRAVGIDAVAKPLTTSQYYDVRNRRQFAMETTHVACGSTVDPFAEVNNLHSQWTKPVGEISPNNIWGYKNPDYDAIVDKIALVPPGDPGLKPLFRQALEMRLRDLPIIAMAQQIRVVPYSTKYWTNWPTSKNAYIHPPNWWMTFLIPVVNIKPAT
jgi:peptide/nickel transport system substrate-binding protein